MKQFNKTVFAAGLAGLAGVAVAVDQAKAGGFAVREQSTEFQGMSFAGAAAGGMGLSSMFFNPAAVTEHDGLNSESNAALIIGDSKTKNAGLLPGVPLAGASNSGNISDGQLGRVALVPSSYYSYQYNEQIYLGMSINAPFGLETKSKGYAGTPHGLRSKIFNIVANPMVGYKFNDMVSIAVGPQISYIDGTLTSSLTPFPPGNSAGSVKLTGDDWGIGWTAGILFKLSEATRFGIGFRSEIVHKLKGRFKVGVPFGINVSATAAIDLPATLTVSASHKVTDALTIKASYEWADWSSLKNLTISGAPGAFGVPTPFNWKDSHFYSIGAEYQVNEVLAVRGGFAYEDSPVPDSTRGPRVPDNNRYWLSAGASYQWNDWVLLHGAFTHIIVEKAPIALTVPSPLFATFKTNINIVSVGATLNW